jgi:hypothetical protein
VFLAAALALALASEAHAGESCYLLMFGAQQVPTNPNHSHTFATFIRARWPGNDPCPPAPCLEAVTISWLPENLVVRTFAVFPECGRNFGLHSTLRYVLQNDERVSMWGPYQIEADLYQRALRQYEMLMSGSVRYKANDAGYCSDCVSNCIHAVSGVAEEARVHVLSPGWGEPASYLVLQRFKPWMLDGERTHPWVGAALGLNNYPLIYREMENPRSGAIQGPVLRLLGAERDLQATYGPPPR